MLKSSPTFEQIQKELELFTSLKTQMIEQVLAQSIDQYGLTIIKKKETSLDIFVCGLTHGNEVIGLQIINKILISFLKEPESIQLNWGFLLNNLDAYLENKRFLDFDLNRSFDKNSNSNREFRRAQEIQNIILAQKPKLIIDLHQTVEQTNSLFSIIPEHAHLIRISKKIAPQIDVVTFPANGFSNLGQTLTEYSIQNNIPALVYELGQKGFDDHISENFKNSILAIELDQTLNSVSKDGPVDYWHIETLVPNQNDFVLEPHIESFKPIKKDQILAKNTNGLSYKSPFDGIAIFPRYQNIQKHEEELCYLAIKKQV